MDSSIHTNLKIARREILTHSDKKRKLSQKLFLIIVKELDPNCKIALKKLTIIEDSESRGPRL